MEKIHCVITDDGIGKQDKDLLLKTGTEIITV
jgi:DeoR family galactitol utilization operon repressor